MINLFQGNVLFSNGSTYKHLYSQSDLPHGEGTYTSPDGTKYKGEWRSGKKHGTGMYEYGSGNKYEGDFENDLMHGRGVFIGKRYIYIECVCVSVCLCVFVCLCVRR